MSVKKTISRNRCFDIDIKKPSSIFVSFDRYLSGETLEESPSFNFKSTIFTNSSKHKSTETVSTITQFPKISTINSVALKSHLKSPITRSSKSTHASNSTSGRSNRTGHVIQVEKKPLNLNNIQGNCNTNNNIRRVDNNKGRNESQQNRLSIKQPPVYLLHKNSSQIFNNTICPIPKLKYTINNMINNGNRGIANVVNNINNINNIKRDSGNKRNHVVLKPVKREGGVVRLKSEITLMNELKRNIKIRMNNKIYS